MKLTVCDGAAALFLWQILVSSCHAEYILQTVKDVVGAGNFSYYKLKKQGSVRVSLTSLIGDADLYIASELSHPDYDNYDLKSATCGLDTVDIAEDIVRPVGIGVYGYSSAELSKYMLEIIVFDDQSFESYNRPHSNQQSSSGQHPGANVKADEEESIFSTILVGILKIILDILL